MASTFATMRVGQRLQNVVVLAVVTVWYGLSPPRVTLPVLTRPG